MHRVVTFFGQCDLTYIIGVFRSSNISRNGYQYAISNKHLLLVQTYL